ncbi:hypothetical protein ScPMuIL_004833 [Solemya velum]
MKQKKHVQPGYQQSEKMNVECANEHEERVGEILVSFHLLIVDLIPGHLAARSRFKGHPEDCTQTKVNTVHRDKISWQVNKIVDKRVQGDTFLANLSNRHPKTREIGVTCDIKSPVEKKEPPISDPSDDPDVSDNNSSKKPSPDHDCDESFTLDDSFSCEDESNEVKSLYHMEKKGLVRSIQYLTEKGVTVGTMVTDRHMQIGKWIRENMPNTKRCFDVWHVAKGLKKLTALAKERECDLLQPWIQIISNHLYWVASSTPDGCGELMWQKWLSLRNHVQNKCEGHGELFRRCLHDDLNGSVLQKWFQSGTEVCENLNTLTSVQMKKDVPKLSCGQKTSDLEAFHSVVNQFAPKMIGFSYSGMENRLYLPALHYSESRQREQATTEDGDYSTE